MRVHNIAPTWLELYARLTNASNYCTDCNFISRGPQYASLSWCVCAYSGMYIYTIHTCTYKTCIGTYGHICTRIQLWIENRAWVYDAGLVLQEILEETPCCIFLILLYRFIWKCTKIMLIFLKVKTSLKTLWKSLKNLAIVWVRRS